MEEKVEYEKSLSLQDMLLIIRARLVWIILIVFLCVGVGIAYITFLQKTTYTAVADICVHAKDYEVKQPIKDELGNIYDWEDVPANVAEHIRYQYSALIAPEFQKVFLSNEITTAVKSAGISINVGAVGFAYTEESAFFKITYTYKNHGGDANAIKEEITNVLNQYINKSIEIINDENSTYPSYLKDKLMVTSAATKYNVIVNTGKTTTLLISLLIGLLLSAVFVIILYFIDDTISSKEDVEYLTGVGNLAFIDISANENTNNNLKEKA